MKNHEKILIFLLLATTYAPGLSSEEPAENTGTYIQQRTKLVSEVRAHHFARDIVLSDKEEKVDAYLRSLQEQEYRRKIFLPDRNFLEVRELILASPLYEFLRNMPKGAFLHAHAPALGDFEWVIKTATYRPDCYMYVGERTKVLVPGAVALFKAPPSDSWVAVTALRAKSGDPEEFDHQLLESFTLTAQDRFLPDIWKKFSACFMRFHRLFHNLEFSKAYIKRNLLYLIEKDNLQHVELRESVKEPRLLMYREILREIRKQYPYFTIRIIGYSHRTCDRQQVLQDARETLEMRKKYPELVAGFDIVAEEDAGHSTLYYIDDLISLNKLATREGVELPYFFHDGETNWAFGTYVEPDKLAENSEIPYNDNLYDVLLLKAKRVGHGLNLVKNPYLMNRFKEANIVIELCPISNQVLGYIDDLRNHPGLTYLNADLRATINSDDPGVFGYQGISPDFWEVCIAWALDLRALKKLAMNSIQYSSLSEQQKKDQLAVWEKKWAQFIDNYAP